MRSPYNHRECQSLFGYAEEVHKRSKGTCQLCGCDAGNPPNFDLWRQMSVKHLIGEAQGGYLRELRNALARRFPDLPPADRERLAQRLDAVNTVTACRFCNSMTSRYQHPKDMDQLLTEAHGTPDEVVSVVIAELQRILEDKRSDVRWKLQSVREAFERLVIPTFSP